MRLKAFILLIASLCLLISGPGYAASGNTRVDSFNEAKKLLLDSIYTDHRLTLYCGSRFDQAKRVYFGKEFTPVKSSLNRAARLEWEHVVPAEAFGKSFKEWMEGHPSCVEKSGKPFKGRKCAEKASLEFRFMESDMYNLYPESG